MRQRLLIVAGAAAIAVVVPTAMAVTNGGHVVCDAASEQFRAGAFITAVEPRAADIEAGPSVCVTFPEWYSANESRTVEVSVGNALYDRRLRLTIDGQTPLLIAGPTESWVGGQRSPALTTVRSVSVQPMESDGFDSTPGVPQRPVDEVRLHIDVSNPRDGVLYSADIGGDVRSRLGAVLARIRAALLPTAVLLALYFGAVFLWRRAGSPPDLPPDAQAHFERPTVTDLTGQQQVYGEGLSP